MMARGGGPLMMTYFLAALAGCIDLVPVSPPPDRPAALNISLRVDEDLSDGGPRVVPVGVTAILDRGVDRDGLPRETPDLTLTVAGQELDPVEVDPAGRIGWSATIGVIRESLLDGAFEVRTPMVAPGMVAEFPVRWPLLVRVGPNDFDAPAGTSVRLEAAFVNLPGQPVADATRWSLAAFGPAGWFSRGGDGPPPVDAGFPVDDLGSPGSVLLAIVTQARTFEVPAAGGEYLVRMELSQEARWNVTVTGEP